MGRKLAFSNVIKDVALTPAQTLSVQGELLARYRPPERLDLVGYQQTGQHVREHHIHVDFERRSWRLQIGNFVAEYRDGRIHDSEGNESLNKFGENLPSHALRLLFPENLRVWGRARDDFRPLLLQERAGLLIMTFEHVTDPTVQGTLTMDIALGLFTRHVRSDLIVQLHSPK